ncbi:camphor resistance protein CrcB [Pseudomonas agarici]|uniref:Fluoride-specific ion channel FluC n=1 Tax=Pseudomonas agarici TaxID=46677 RepID=A0A0X1T3J4_PSEAA|nr:fluoride efflux transporter CrcB [Pseudomonas agarici]AMB86429.1 camphor resistance protein CrcB [Pseudomonas agarici]NWB93764.1 fluoride efflux transporter CrcB [Pseudomonas agarici]NWC09376.1 fluoride efflux transporter CrcB [Pseudomonas agarici]SEL47564.1 camphor resistance protein CrcB [Pseudomonas agarici]
MIRTVLAVSVAGIVGTLVRFATGNLINANWPKHFYTATLAVNIVGCLVIGVLYGLFLLRPEVPVEIRAGLIVGFVGGLTTFSSFSLDTVRLLESGQGLLAIGYVALSVFGGLLATWAGLSLTKL